MADRLNWERDGVGWPNRPLSRFVTAAGLTWHIQRGGKGPPLLLVHGTAASTHSWAALLPLLAERFDVLVLDLPGHGFTDPLPDAEMTLTGMAAAVTGLIRQLAFVPRIAIGHSAGAAIIVRMSLDGALAAPHRLIAINGALLPFGGVASRLFSPMAKLLALNPLMPRLFAWRAESVSAVKRVIAGTGSQIDEAGLELYARLFRSQGHVSAALAMMAGWDLETLVTDMARLSNPLSLIACGNDLAISPELAFQIADRVPSARVTFLRGLGHLAHEERPAEITRVILELVASDDGAALRAQAQADAPGQP
jgi:magnesium chelatase accessory protein